MIQPDIRIFIEDETRYWDSKYLQRLGVTRVRCVWLIDAKLDVFIASTQPSREAYFLGREYDMVHPRGSDAEEWAVQEIEANAHDELVEYFGGNVDRDARPISEADAFIDEYLEGDVDHREMMDNIHEYLQGNWPDTRGLA